MNSHGMEMILMKYKYRMTIHSGKTTLPSVALGQSRGLDVLGRRNSRAGSYVTAGRNVDKYKKPKTYTHNVFLHEETIFL